MDKQTLEYIRNRAQGSDTGSIKAVSCPDIRALLAERAALLEALKWALDVMEIHEVGIGCGTQKAARAAIQKAEG